MIKRSNFITALICIILSLVCAFGVAFSGCAEYKPPENGGDTPTLPDDPDDPVNPDDPVENSTDFTVQLVIKPSTTASWRNFTYEYYEASDNKDGVHEQGWIEWESIKVQWTNVETNARHFAALNDDGKAVCSGLDGDYKVTLTSIPTGFTYEPNINYTDNITKKIEVSIYKIQQTKETVTMNIRENNNNTEVLATRLPKTGAFRTTLNSKDDRVMFFFQPSRQGTYSFTTLVDVTENKINPKLSMYVGQVANRLIYPEKEQDDGGSANTYTKNVYFEYKVSADMVNNALFFELHSTSVDGNSSYPLVVDFLIQRDGDYTRTDLSTMVQVTEDFSKTPTQPSGTFTWAARNPVTEGLLVNSKTVILNTEPGRLADYLKSGAKVEMGAQATLNDGYYYFFDYDEATNTYTLTDRVYAVINKPNEILDFNASSTWSVRYLFDSEDSTKYNNYSEFMGIYQEHCNEDGAYPVNRELAKFLQDFCISYRIFNDGNGEAEKAEITYTDENGVTHTQGYNADEKGMWLFSCGYYKQ